LLTKSGSYGLLSKIVYSELTWVNGKCWSDSSSAVDHHKELPAACYSNIIPLNGATSISVTKIPLADRYHMKHCFFDDNDEPVEFFGNIAEGAQGWGPYIGTYQVPVGATKVAFSWVFTSPSDVNFKCWGIDVSRTADVVYSDLQWSEGNAYWTIQGTINKTLTMVMSELYDISQFDAFKISTLPFLNYNFANAAFFDENKNFIIALRGEMHVGNDYTDSYAVVRVPYGAKYASFNYVSSKSENFYIRRCQVEEFNISEDCLTLVLWNKNKHLNVNDDYDNNGGYEIIPFDLSYITNGVQEQIDAILEQISVQESQYIDITENYPVLPS